MGVVQDTMDPSQVPKEINWVTASDTTVNQWAFKGYAEAVRELFRRTESKPR